MLATIALLSSRVIYFQIIALGYKVITEASTAVSFMCDPLTFMMVFIIGNFKKVRKMVNKHISKNVLVGAALLWSQRLKAS